MLRLVITDSSGERAFATDQDEILLGRRDDVDLRVADAAASRSHCLVRVAGAHVLLTDLGTVNGTYVGGARIEQAKLAPGDEFRIGTTTLRVAAFSGATSTGVRPAPALAGTAPAGRRKPRLELEPDDAPARPPPAGPRAPVPTGGGPSDFARELRAIISNAPWYLISLVVHIVALMVLDLITFSRKPETVFHVINAELPGEAKTLDEPDDIDVPDIAVLGEEVADEIVIDDEPKKADRQEVAPATAPRQLELGAAGPRRPMLLKTPLPRKASYGKAVEGGIDKTNLESEHEGAAEIVRREIARGGLGVPKGIPADRILVVQGEFDKMERVLDMYAIRYTLIRRDELLRRRYARARLLCLNCGRQAGAAERSKLAKIVKSFIQTGGWVITSDWALEPYLTIGFPDRVRRIEARRQPDTVITVAPEGTSPILKGVFSRRARSDWWLEETSTLFEVTPSKVNVLIVSEDLDTRYGARVVAFDFESGSGRVLHLLGHFYQKDGNRMGIVGMHRLILNYILERFPSSGSGEAHR